MRTCMTRATCQAEASGCEVLFSVAQITGLDKREAMVQWHSPAKQLHP